VGRSPSREFGDRMAGASPSACEAGTPKGSHRPTEAYRRIRIREVKAFRCTRWSLTGLVSTEAELPRVDLRSDLACVYVYRPTFCNASQRANAASTAKKYSCSL
jgi:hypothetical protein